jgi:hypothetical protein
LGLRTSEPVGFVVIYAISDEAQDFWEALGGSNRFEALQLVLLTSETDVSSLGVAFSFTENATAAAGRLKVTDGTHSVTIDLFGQHVAAGFHAAPNRGGLGTAITYQNPQLMPALSTSLHPP